MVAFSRISIRTRLYFGTVFSLILLVIIGAMGYVALDRTRSTLQVLFSERVQTLTRLQGFKALELRVAHIKRLVVAGPAVRQAERLRLGPGFERRPRRPCRRRR